MSALKIILLSITFAFLLAACISQPTQTPAPTKASSSLTTQTVVPSKPSDSSATQAAAPTKASASAVEWSTRAPLLQPNSELAIAELNGKVYVIGGYPSNRVTVAVVEVYDPTKDRWELTTPSPQPLNHAMAASANGKLYVIGGQRDTGADYVDTVYEYDPASAAWITKASMPTKRSAGAAVVVEGKIYVMGGRPPRGSDFGVYDPRANIWSNLPNLPTARNHLAAAAIAGKIYVAGGRFGPDFGSEVTNVLEMFDPATNKWNTKAPMPTARGGVNGIEANGCFHVWGGEGQNIDHPLGVFPEHEVYNPVNDTWTRLAPMPTPVHGVTGSAFIDGWVYVPGGGTSYGGSSGSTIHQVFRPTMTCR